MQEMDLLILKFLQQREMGGGGGGGGEAEGGWNLGLSGFPTSQKFGYTKPMLSTG